MTEAELVALVRKLQYQVQILGQTIDGERHPVEALILGKDWGEEDIDKAHDIFDKWDQKLERGEKMESGDFEMDFQRQLGVSYQGLKSIILSFYRNSQWTAVCEAYVDSFGKSPSVEYHAIMRRER